ncbi:MAG: VWA domain-containing protein [Gammaproteobacteria bacterium]|nr:VWA domain-containing protein [Gammaproteobacteria bacterium]
MHHDSGWPIPSDDGYGENLMWFLFPEGLLLALLVLPAAWILWRHRRHADEAAAAFGGQSNTAVFFRVRLGLACLFFLSLAAIAARPYVVYSKSADVLFLVDVSRSMQARHSCSEPTFLDRAKTVLKQTVAGLPQANIGLFAFDRFAFPVTQMTSDSNYLYDVIDNGLYVGLMLQATQTEIANALSAVAEKKRRLPDVYGGVSHLVLLTDGNVQGNYRRRLAAAIAELEGEGIRLSAVGIGNAEETPIADSENGQCLDRKLEVNGDAIMIPLRTDVLKFAAAESGGDYFSEYEVDRMVRSITDDLTYTTDARPGARRDVSNMFVIVASLALLAFVYAPALSRQPD